MARILIVDDEESERLLQSRILERHGHETITASDGGEALRNHQLEGIDVVITDLQMPDIHGLELISILRNLTPRPAILAVSGTGPDQLGMADAVGAHFTLTKPIYAEQLIAAVDKALETRDQAGGDPSD